MIDVYYKTEGEEDNYRRTLAQFTMMQRMLDRQEEMEEIVEQTVTALQ
jgi:hypothetical protein